MGDTCQLMGPLVSKSLIKFSQQRAAHPENPPNIGRGIAMAIGLFLLTISASVFTHQVSLCKGVCGDPILLTNYCFSSFGDQCKQAFWPEQLSLALSISEGSV